MENDKKDSKTERQREDNKYPQSRKKSSEKP
jgi:hypothetical protein